MPYAVFFFPDRSPGWVGAERPSPRAAGGRPRVSTVGSCWCDSGCCWRRNLDCRDRASATLPSSEPRSRRQCRAGVRLPRGQSVRTDRQADWRRNEREVGGSATLATPASANRAPARVGPRNSASYCGTEAPLVKALPSFFSKKYKKGVRGRRTALRLAPHPQSPVTVVRAPWVVYDEVPTASRLRRNEGLPIHAFLPHSPRSRSAWASTSARWATISRWRFRDPFGCARSRRREPPKSRSADRYASEGIRDSGTAQRPLPESTRFLDRK